MDAIPVLPYTSDLASLQDAIYSGAGCAIVRGMPVAQMTRDAASSAYSRLAEQLGEVIPQTLSGTLIYSVRDEGYQLQRDFGQAGVRTSKTTAGFGFHTDSPSRIAGQMKSPSPPTRVPTRQ